MFFDVRNESLFLNNLQKDEKSIFRESEKKLYLLEDLKKKVSNWTFFQFLLTVFIATLFFCRVKGNIYFWQFICCSIFSCDLHI